MLRAARSRFCQSAPPRSDPHAEPLDGLDGVIFNGVDPRAGARARVRAAASQARAREQHWVEFWGED